jgi:hypothetical protein
MNAHAQPLQPNLAQISEHLYALIDPTFVHPYPDAWIEIAYGHPAIKDGAINGARMNSPCSRAVRS